ncbi:survival motor neuron protein-like isoform X3 [Epinephelus moara]|uniref:survival motor neuron protein-like isoform X3 n=1 Tax=Epinephelus moara TaxID=300413 RepID=UPI00214E742E|nr:survival motor neuron protein-like isoform X3 [Epinephelus moara]
MTELTENSFLGGATESEESVTAAGKDETSLTEALENTLDISQWVVGAKCRAVWLEDGRVYPATLVSLDGERCRVRFSGYGNQQDMDLSALKGPEAVVQTQRQNSQEWKPGSRCRAVYSEDGLVYPAVILWVKGQRCCVRFNDYNNEEEQDVSSLLSPDELHGPSRASAAKGSSWKSSVTSSNVEWKRSRREERQQGERGERRREENHVGDRGGEQVKEKLSSKVEKEAEEKKTGNQQTDGAEKLANHSFCFFPPFPPPPQSGSGGPVSFIPPPPPPLWTFAGRDSSGSTGVDASSSMLMLWYMCGFHTGSYMAQQVFKSSSKD